MPRSMAGGALVALAACVGAVSSPTMALAADPAAPARVVADLAAVCSPGRVQSALIGVSPAVTVREIPNGPKFPGGTRFVAAAGGAPAFCQVTGSFVTNALTGKTANFLATLPASWNGKYLQLGCAGHCGRIWGPVDPSSPEHANTVQGGPLQTIKKGYATFITDEGHEELGAAYAFDWATKAPGVLNEDPVKDFYYRAQQTLARVGKQFAVNFYASATNSPRQPLAFSYFAGCSGGGRDALVAASYFPEEFDGIISGSPYAVPMNNAMQYAAYTLAQLRSEGAYIPVALERRIDGAVMARCDKLDGVVDGLIQNPMACDFRPERDLPQCDGKRPRSQCFTKEQIDTLSVYISAVTDEAGRVVQPGYSVSDIRIGHRVSRRPADLSALEPYGPADPQAGPWNLGNGSLRYLGMADAPGYHTRSTITLGHGGPGPVDGLHAVVPSTFVTKVNDAARMGTGGIPENAAKLIGQNRKLLMWVNLSDPALTPYMSINYYKQLAKLHGGYDALQKNVRLFALPGTLHCTDPGPGPNSFDPLTALEDWVERAQPPVALQATLYDLDERTPDPSKPPLRSMPLCAFPAMARYSGQGDINDGRNWSCPVGDKRMLQMGESGRRAGVID